MSSQKVSISFTLEELETILAWGTSLNYLSKQDDEVWDDLLAQYHLSGGKLWGCLNRFPDIP